ncbi:MAG: hypothetical protein GX592_01025 [Clostridiales bacterium]|nr:hypothetical protein [Clostridiales bacterium]
MIHLFPEPKRLIDKDGLSRAFAKVCFPAAEPELVEIAKVRFWNYRDIEIAPGEEPAALPVVVERSLDGIDADRPELLKQQGYALNIAENAVHIRYENRAGYINAITSVKMLIQSSADGFRLPLCEIADWPSLPVRAVAPTFSWYAGYGRIGFDCQLWGFDEWAEFMNICLDNKINQFNMVMYGYWPFEFDEYPETVFRDIPVKIWNAENRRWLTIRYTHPNIEEPFLRKLSEYAHFLEFKLFAYVGLNSYNGAYSIKHPEARTKPPKTGVFLNDFDSLCLSHPGTVDYIVRSMERIAELGFDGFTIEESEECFWYCECDGCKETWHRGVEPVEAKHSANIWLLNRIYGAVRAINPDAVLGIRAFRQPPLEKDPAFLKKTVESMPDDIMLFWAPGLYVPETEFPKWCDAFGRHRIWARDTESNSITSTMGRLCRTFKSNMLRYGDEANEQVIETDIRQHLGSVAMGVHGVNGFMFEWFGLFMHLFAHGNYGWGSRMDPEEFFPRVCALNFGEWGPTVLSVMREMLTIHESQMPLYTTPFPFQKNKVMDRDIPAILAARENHPKLLRKIEQLQEASGRDARLAIWRPHFDKWRNAERRNAVIYDMMLAALDYEREQDPARKDALLDEILRLNERDFDIAKEMFFDVNPVGETGVRSCMFPYHEIKRLIHNIRHPESPDEDIICSGIEALGWLWL